MLSDFRSIALQEVIFSNQERGVGSQERGAGNQELDVSNPIFVVGRNGSGKSNFADAFAFLSEAMASPLQVVVERRGGFSAVSRRDSTKGGLASVTLSVELQIQPIVEGYGDVAALPVRRGASYLETVDQPAFSAVFSLSCAYRRSRSFRKLADSFANLVRDMGHEIGVWPPPAWTGGA